MKAKITDHYLTQLDRKVGAKNNKILLFDDQCAAHLKTPTFLDVIGVVYLPANYTRQLQSLGLGTIHAFKCNYRKQPIWKTVVMMNGGTPPRHYTD
jgi:hypothetical protein